MSDQNLGPLTPEEKEYLEDYRSQLAALLAVPLENAEKILLGSIQASRDLIDWKASDDTPFSEAELDRLRTLESLDYTDCRLLATIDQLRARVEELESEVEQFGPLRTRPPVGEEDGRLVEEFGG